MTTLPSDDFNLETREKPGNTLGLVGFILSFCLSPIGLILSLIGLMKSPRGFAIAGVLVGLIGTVIWGFLGWGLVTAVRMVNESQTAMDRIRAVQTALEGAKGTDGAYPADLSALNLGASATDPWGHPMTYERSPDGLGYLMGSAGKDGVPGTGDDFEVTPWIDQNLIYGIVAISVAGRIFGDVGNGMGSQGIHAGRDLFNLQMAISHQKEKGGLPESLDKLPGIVPRLLTDPWGTPYVYTPASDGASFMLRSNGPDKQPSTRDDIDSADMQRRINEASRSAPPRSGK